MSGGAADTEIGASEIKIGDWVAARGRVEDVDRLGATVRFENDAKPLWLPRGEILSVIAPPEPDWANVPRGTRVEVRDAECDEWKRVVFVAYLPDEEEYQFVAKWCGPGNTPYGWRYCRLAGGEHE